MLEEAGVDHFVHLGADAVALHTRLLDRLGIAP
jgi:phosphotransferase system IIA component